MFACHLVLALSSDQYELISSWLRPYFSLLPAANEKACLQVLSKSETSVIVQGGGGEFYFFLRIFIIFFRGPCENLKPYNNPFCGFE